MGSPFHLIIFSQRALFGVVLIYSFLASSLFGDKVTESVIVASIEGEVSSLNLIDDFKVNMSSSYVGKKISSKTILTTGKTGKVSLLFSNGTLITIKPGSRFYLRKYKQLEAVVEDLTPPGKLEEEPTKSELSAHLDFGDLIVKAPKLKKGSSMNLSSPIGTAGIRGTMFQFMAVRNPVTGDIMGGINLVSGDIEFTDTDGNTVTILSGQSIQLATSKLGESVASQTGELVDLSSTYGPALSEAGALPPPISSIFPYLNLGGDSDEESSESDGFLDEPILVGSSPAGLDFIHEIASDLFFSIEEAEQVSSEFTFESLQFAPPVEAPLPEVQTPSAPAAVTGETVAGGNIDRFMGVAPEINLRNISSSGASASDPLFYESPGGNRIIAEFRSPDEGLDWMDLDPGVNAKDFLDNNIENIVAVSNIPNLVLQNPETAELDAPPVGESVFYNVVYQVTDFRNSSSTITREVEVKATRPSINNIPALPSNFEYYDPEGVFEDWIDGIKVFDVRGTQLTRGESLAYAPGAKVGSYYLDPLPSVQTIGETSFKIVAKDWRGLISESEPFLFKVTATPPSISYPELAERYPYTDPNGLFDAWINQIVATDVRDENVSRASPLLYNSSNSQNSFFYLTMSPSNQLDIKGTKEFKIIAKDWRGVETESDTLKLNVTALPPAFEIKSGNLFVELSDQPISSIEHNITGTDEFNQTIDQASIFLASVDHPSFAPDSRIDSLANEDYLLKYNVRDTRGEITEVNRTLRVYVTSPVFNGVTFESNASWISEQSTLEYLDPENELDDWIASQSATDLNGTFKDNTVPGKITSKIISATYGGEDLPESVLNSTDYKNLPLGTYVIEFTALDRRYDAGETNEVWRDNLTTDPYFASLEIIATSPPFSVADLDSDRFGENNRLEYFDPNSELSSWIGNQSSTDIFNQNRSISVVAEILEYNGSTPGTEITNLFTPPYYGGQPNGQPEDNLPIGNYKLKFTATDPRLSDIQNDDAWQAEWLDEFTTEDNITIEIVATAPTFDEINATLSATFEVDNRRWVEDLFDPWINTIKVTDFNATELTMGPVGEPNKGFFSLLVEPDLRTEGNTTIEYKATDYRGVSSSVTRNVEVIKTPPVISIAYTDLDLELSGLSANNDVIKYLVKPRGVLSSVYKSKYGDEINDIGAFTLPSEKPAGKNKPYYVATAYNGETLEGTVDGSVNYEVLGDYQVIITVDDSSVRNTGNGEVVSPATTIINTKVSIVDVLPPVLEIKPLAGLNQTPYATPDGSIHGLKNVQFPDPGLIIHDNYYTQAEIEQNNSITTSDVDFTYTFPGKTPDPWAGEQNFSDVKTFPSTFNIIGSVDMGKAGVYTLSYNILSDLSGNESDPIDLERTVTVIDKRAPVVSRFGLALEYVDLRAILVDKTSSYFEAGVYAEDDLFHEKAENGKIYFDADDASSPWTVTYQKQVYNDDSGSWENDGGIVNDGLTPVQNIVDGYITSYESDKSSVPTEPIRYVLTYSISDESNNSNSISRTVELRNSPNIEVQMTELASTTTSDVESGDFVEPLVRAFINYGGSLGEVDVSISKTYYWVNDQGEVVDSATASDANRVNYHDNKYVDANKSLHSENTPDWRKLVLRYYAEDPDNADNFIEKNTTVIRTDTTLPQLVLNSYDSSSYAAFQAGDTFTDSGINSIVNPGGGTVDVMVGLLSDDAKYVFGPYETQFTTDNNTSAQTFTWPIDYPLKDIIFEYPFDYQIFYTITDDLGNEYKAARELKVVDSIQPHIALITKEFLVANQHLNFNQDTEPSTPWESNYTRSYVESKIAGFNPSYPEDSNVSYLRVTGDDSNHFILKLSEVEDSFDFIYAEGGIVYSNGEYGTGWFTTTKALDTNQSFIWHRALVIDEFSDPGVFVENRSTLEVEVRAKLEPTFGSGGALKNLSISYEAKQEGGTWNQIANVRTISFVDESKPTLSITPRGDIENNEFVYVEAGQVYTDANNMDINYSVNGSVSSSTSSWYAFDTTDGTLTNDIQIVRFVDLNDSENNVSLDTQLPNYFARFVDTDNYLNRVLRVDYHVEDSAQNEANASRYLIVQDKRKPIISLKTGADQTLVIGYGTSDANSSLTSDFNDAKAKIIEDLEVNDFGIDSDFDYTLNPEKWDIELKTTPWLGNKMYPIDSSQQGYQIDITVTDASGNISDVFTRYLKVEDKTNPVITLLGESVIHDFLRYSQNSDLNNSQLVFDDGAHSASLNPYYNGSGFIGGAHRFLLSDYRFIDPGAYATDQFPSLDGSPSIGEEGFFTSGKYPTYKGKPTGFLLEQVTEQSDYDDCKLGPGIIHVYAAEADRKIIDGNIKHFQEKLADSNSSFYQPNNQLTGVDVDESSTNFGDANKPEINDDTNSDKISVYEATIYYKVKDGWGNTDEKIRRVYIYESRQFADSAFYATPINEVGSGDRSFPGFYDDENASILRDFDGDGVSDYWELQLGTRIDDPSSYPSQSSLKDPEYFYTKLSGDWNATFIPGDD